MWSKPFVSCQKSRSGSNIKYGDLNLAPLIIYKDFHCFKELSLPYSALIDLGLKCYQRTTVKKNLKKMCSHSAAPCQTELQ